MSKKYNVKDILEPCIEKMIYSDLMNTRRCMGDDQFIYTPQECGKDGVSYIVSGRHVSIDESKKYSKSNCKDCYGKGYRIENIEKEKISNVEDFMMISSFDIRNASETQKKIIIEKEKLKKYWKVVLPCRCTIEKMRKKGIQIVSNNKGNVLIEITCTKKDT